MPIISTVTAAFQVFSLTGSILILAVCAVVARRWRDVRSLLVFPALWSVYGVVFYVAVLTRQLSPQALLMWGAVHRFVAVIMVLGGVLALWAILAAPEPPEYESDLDDESE